MQARFEESNNRFFDEFLPGQSFEKERPEATVDSIRLKEVEQMVYELTKTLLSEKVNSERPGIKQELASAKQKIQKEV